MPVVVVASAEAPGQRYVLNDGYLRVDSLEQLHRDEVLTQEWEMTEGRALALAHHLESARERSALEEGWLLSILEREHGMGLPELSILLCRSRSWVSRRLALVQALPAINTFHLFPESGFSAQLSSNRRSHPSNGISRFACQGGIRR